MVKTLQHKEYKVEWHFIYFYDSCHSTLYKSLHEKNATFKMKNLRALCSSFQKCINIFVKESKCLLLSSERMFSVFLGGEKDCSYPTTVCDLTT